MPISFTGNSAPTVQNGFADYNDTSTSTTPVDLVSNVWTDIPNDGAGAFTNTTYLPTDTTRLMDTATGEFLFDELSLGDTVYIRNDFTVTPATNNQLLKLRYTLGAGAGTYTLETTIGRLDSGSGVGYRFSLVPFFIYIGDLNTKDNPVKLQLKTTGNATIVNAGSAVGVTKR